MEVDQIPTTLKPPTAAPVPEVEIYLRLLILHHLHTSPSTYARSKDLALETIEKMQTLNRRSMDPIAAKVWYAVDRTYELNGELSDARPSVSFHFYLGQSEVVYLIRLSDSFWLHSERHLSAMMTMPKPHSSIGFCAIISTTAYMTKLISLFRKPHSLHLLATPNLLATIII
jgi:hypothetical protein